MAGSQKVVSLPELETLCASARQEGRKVVLCHGVFDLLHPGHLGHLKAACAEGDLLVVTVTPDRFVNKGPGRPVYSEDQRVEMIAALQVVDYAAINDGPTAIETIRRLRPDVYAKGADYTDPDADTTGNISVEEEAVVAVGGRIHFTDEPSLSSSELINQHLPPHSPEARNWIAGFRARHGTDEVVGWLTGLSGLKVLVVGEAIIDEYVTCEALGKSSKDPVLAFRQDTHVERQAGGSLAIANHCAGLGGQVTCLFRLGSNPADQALVLESLHPDVRPVFVESATEPTIIKRRYVDQLTEARVFETYQMAENSASADDVARFRQELGRCLHETDLAIVADYGHGLLTEQIIGDLTGSDVRLAVNTQSNAGNRGFNTISKYGRTDFVCLNGGEVGLELRRHHLTMDELVPQLLERTGARRVLVTEGAKGLVACEPHGVPQHAPAFAPQVRDRVGAGDALFAMTSMLFALDAPLDIVGFYGNLAGAASVAQLGNRSHLRGGDIARHAIALLK